MAPGITELHPRNGSELEDISDQIDSVNILRSLPVAGAMAQGHGGKTSKFDDAPEFDAQKDRTEFRRYEDASASVKAFYKEQHEKQTYAYNAEARRRFAGKCRAIMSIWEAMETLNTLIDESDPDTSLSQIEHFLQTAEAIRKDGKPRWMQLTGLIHDLGKLLYFFGAEGQWDVVGDTFPVGCAFDQRIILSDSFENNPDNTHPIYSCELGVYSEGCGLDNVLLSWGHDEYLYGVVKDQSTIPAEGLAMIRYHSFYAWHREGAYTRLMNEHDKKMLKAVKAFSPYDLYSKSDDTPSVEELRPYYLELIDEFFPTKVIRW